MVHERTLIITIQMGASPRTVRPTARLDPLARRLAARHNSSGARHNLGAGVGIEILPKERRIFSFCFKVGAIPLRRRATGCSSVSCLLPVPLNNRNTRTWRMIELL